MTKSCQLGVLSIACALAASCCFAAVQVYHIEPREYHAGWTVAGPSTYIGQSFVACADSLSYIEWLCGDLSQPGYYVFDVLETGTNRVVAHGDTLVPANGWQWVRCDRFTQGNRQLTKGREYVVKVSHSAGDSVCYVYRTDNPYGYGQISVGGGSWNQSHEMTICDLALRMVGTMNVIDSTYWGVDPMFPFWETRTDSMIAHRWVDRSTTAGVGAARVTIDWNSINPVNNEYWFRGLDTTLDYVADSAGCEITGLLLYTPKWASSRIVPVAGSDGGSSWMDTSLLCAPRGLWANGNDNCWYHWLNVLASHCGSRLRSIIVWNEPNDVETTSTHAGVTGWWRRPNSGGYDIGYNTHDLCSLYVQMCWLAESVFNREHHLNCRILVGDPHRTRAANWSPVNPGSGALISGAEWVDMCYQIAGRSTHGIFWDGVSVHPYQDNHGFSSAEYAQDAETLRAIMRNRGDRSSELWNTEVGWDTIVGESTDANALCEVFVAGKASEALPQGGFDRTFWWPFRETGPRCGNLPLLDATVTTPYMSYYAFKQMTEQLTGKRCNGRVMLGDDRDDSVRIYEFESPADSGRKTWVAWRNDDGTRLRTMNARIPARSDGLTSALLAYSAAPTVAAKSASASGWLPVPLGARPVFITESTAIARPDLVADSVRFDAPLRAGEPATLRVWVRNTGRQTPDALLACTFSGNGESLGVATRTEPIGSNSAVVFTLTLARVPERLRDTVLISATVNPRQSIVEANGLDDNTAYLQTVVR